MRRIMLLGGLLAAAVAFAQGGAEQTHEKLARRFAEAYKAGDSTGMAMLAAEPPRRVSYTLATYLLLLRGEFDAAAALAEARAGGPEGPGLKRLIQTYRAGNRPGADQEKALSVARRLIEAGQTRRASEILPAAGEPVEGTVIGARILWERALLKLREKDLAAAGEWLAECARYSAAIGWWARAVDAQALRLELAKRSRDPLQAMKAADGYLEAAIQLDHREHRYAAYRERAALHEAAGRNKEARSDLDQAIQLSRKLGRPAEEAVLLGRLALNFQTREHMPKRALRFHDESLELARKTEQTPLIHIGLLNSAICLAQLSRHDEALARIEEILGDSESASDEVSGRALAQRAFVLQRLGRYESSRAAYEQALVTLPAPMLRAVGVRTEFARLHLLRGDLHAAEDLYAQVLEEQPDDWAALAGRGSCRAARGDEQGARADFDAAVRLAPHPVARGRVLLQRVAVQRRQGRIREALLTARAALDAYLEVPGADHGNTAVAWNVTADILLLAGKFEEAAKVLPQGAVYFAKLQDPARATPAYLRETLVLMRLEREDDAIRRFGTLRRIVEATGSDALKSGVKVVEALRAESRGQHEDAMAMVAEAEKLAGAAKDPVRLAMALVARSWLEPGKGAESAERALKLLDGHRVAAREANPVIVGEFPWHAASLAVRAHLAAGGPADRVFALLERARAEELRIAFGGREWLLFAALPRPLHEAYALARSRLLEARATGQGVAEAEQRFDAMVRRIGTERPWVGALAFVRGPTLAALQAALDEDEAYLGYLDDPYVRALVVVTRGEAKVVGKYDPQRPFDAVEGLLQGKRRLLIAPDGRLAALPMATAPWKGGIAADVFTVSYVSGADVVVRLRTAPPAQGGDGAFAVDRGPARFGAPLGARPGTRPALLNFGAPGELRLSSGRATVGLRSALGLLHEGWTARTVVIPGTTALRGAAPRGAGAAALAHALWMNGSSDTLLSLLGATPEGVVDGFYAGLLDSRKPSGEALRAIKRAIRAGDPDPRRWAGLIRFGLP